MSIQSSINQMITSASLMAGLYSQSPTGKRQAELRQIKGQEKRLKGMESTIESETSSESPGAPIEKFYDTAVGVAQRKFELDPNEKNWKNLEEWSGGQQAYLEGEEYGAKVMQATKTSDERLTTDQIINAIRKTKLQERAEILKQAQHIQSQEKRGKK